MKTLNERILKRISEISKNDCILKDLIIEDLLMLYTRYGEDIAMEIREKHLQTHQDEIDRLKAQHAEEIAKIQAEKKEAECYLEETEREYHNVLGKYEGYRQAVKDILGGEG